MGLSLGAVSVTGTGGTPCHYEVVRAEARSDRQERASRLFGRGFFFAIIPESRAVAADRVLEGTRDRMNAPTVTQEGRRRGGPAGPFDWRTNRGRDRLRHERRDPRLSSGGLFLSAGVWNAVVLLRELRDRGYTGGYSILKDYLRPQATGGP